MITFPSFVSASVEESRKLRYKGIWLRTPLARVSSLYYLNNFYSKYDIFLFHNSETADLVKPKKKNYLTTSDLLSFLHLIYFFQIPGCIFWTTPVCFSFLVWDTVPVSFELNESCPYRGNRIKRASSCQFKLSLTTHVLYSIFKSHFVN